MDKIQIKLYELLECISNAQELVSPKLSNHHQQVAYLAFQLSQQINLSVEQQQDIFLASLIHDIGALSSEELLELIETEPITVNNHAFRGANLLKGFNPMYNSAGIIKFHHIPWDNGKGNNYMEENIPFSSHIIHLADRLCAMIHPEENILTQLPYIMSEISKQSNSVFIPDIVDALHALNKKEYIWLDLVSQSPAKMIYNSGLFNILILGIDDIIDLALIYSRIIDFRSPFTARHSAGVAKTAESLAQLAGFSPYECKMMLIAGYLHDLGKIGINNSVLEKPTKLNEDEFNEMRAHSYYTYRLLEPLSQLKTINTWASFHHERPDGTGYPFHILGDNLSLGSRIIAVSDVFTAITENRPYRKGMNFEDTKKILRNMSIGNKLDKKITDLLIDNFSKINNIRKNAQIKAGEQYESFLHAGDFSCSTEL